MSVHALVPLKDLVQAKSRLSGLLTPSERRALAQAMAEDVLAVLSSHPEITGVTLVSDDPGAEMLAQKYAAHWWPETAFSVRGLNPLMQAASERLFDAQAHTLLVLHADLPLVTREDISAVIAARQVLNGLIIGCDREGRGTNLLSFSRDSMPRFHFGSDSCAAHVAAARSTGVPVQILQRLGIAVDVDEAPDPGYVMSCLRHYAQGSTARLLYNTELGARLGVALASIPYHATNGDHVNKGKAS